MRLSNRSHTLAVLRLLAGLTQKEMAAVLHCSAPTIQAIELDKLKLSEKLAGFASLQTGINLAWLLDNDVSKPPVDIKGKPYTKKTFEDFQAIAEIKKDPKMGNDVTTFYQEQIIRRLHALLLRAYINDDTDLCVYKLTKAFDELEKQFKVTEADRKAITPNEPSANAKNPQPTSWVEWISGFYTALDLAEQKKIADRKMKPMSQAEHKARNIKSIQLDDQGQVIVNRFSKARPINLKPIAKPAK